MNSSTRTNTDDACQKFALAYSAWKAADAAVASAAAYGQSDDPMNDALDRQREAICTLLATPAALPYQLLHKFEIVDDLVIREKTEGESSANYPVKAMASLKIDLMNFAEIMKAAEIPG